jgi:hypothetical protein
MWPQLGHGRSNARNGALPIAMGLMLLASETHAFFPSDFREKSFGAWGVSHEAQTREAYDQLAAKYWDIHPVTNNNMIKARTAIAEANMAVDDDQTASALHFDGENFDGGQARLVQLKKDTIAAVKAGDAESARKSLGGALHTLQDFYAHSNWVELGSTDINYALGKEGQSLTYAAFNDITCNECSSGFINRIAFGCHDCSTNTDGFTKLTSGYYFGEDSPGNGTAIPSWKCHHGKIPTSRPMMAAVADTRSRRSDRR